MSVQLKLTNLPKFDGELFSLWKMQITAFLDEHELLGVVENAVNGIAVSSLNLSNERIENEEKTYSAAEKLLMKKSMTAFNVLLLALGKEQLHMVVDVPRGNAHMVWYRLLQRYERKTVASKTQVRNQLHTIHLQEDEVIDMYIARIKQLVLSLCEMGSKMDNDELIYILFKGLPEPYGPLIDTLSTNDNLLFEDACKYIRDRQERIIFSNEDQYEEHAFFAGTFKKGKNGGGNKKNNNNNNNNNGNKNIKIRTCDTCNESGHIAFYCPLNANKPKCDYCRRINHTEGQCYFRQQNMNNKNIKPEEPEQATLAVDDTIVF